MSAPHLFVLCATAQWQKLPTQHVPPASCPSGQLTATASGVLMYNAGQTWLFTNGDWRLQNASSPGVRSSTALSRYGDGAVLFGGVAADGQLLNDTWTWEATSGWTQLPCNPCPPSRSMHSLATHGMGAGEMVIMFGGATTGEPRMTALGDTWLLQDGRWREVQFEAHGPAGTTIKHAAAPPARWGHSMVCPQKQGFCMTFGGGLTQDDHFTDTWRLEVNEIPDKHGWYQVVPVQTSTTTPALQTPPGRWSNQMAECGTGALMATGSMGYRVCVDDTWIWDPATVVSAWGPLHDQNGTWTQQKVAGAHPGHLGGAGMASVRDGVLVGVLLFGGIPFKPGTTKIGPLMNETWYWPETGCPK